MNPPERFLQMSDVLLGIIGGSGFYEMQELSNIREVTVDTPFGPPSDSYILGSLGNREVAFLPRHGKGHSIPPTAINVNANIWGFKYLGAKWLVSISAVGSMRDEIEPLHMVVPNQLFDRTRSRDLSFFTEPGLAVHIGMAEPFCTVLRAFLIESAIEAGAYVHPDGTYICIEGPQFSTLAESRIYQSWGVDVIGMTAIPEAKLAREAELPYATLAMATDYDVWKGEPVSLDMVIKNSKLNTEMAKRAIRILSGKLPSNNSLSEASNALASAINTSSSDVPDALKQKLDLLVGKYFDTSTQDGDT